jgi:hypothetical protein
MSKFPIPKATAIAAGAVTEFELAVIDSRDGRVVPIRQPGLTQSDLYDATFRLVIGGIDYVGEAWSLGPLDRLVLQLEYVRARLEQDQVALLRSGVEDQLDVPYYLFEPDGAAVRVSGFIIPDRTVGTVFSIDVDGFGGADPERLYDYVRAHREELLSACGPDTFREVSCPRAALLGAIESEVAAARGVMQRLT